MWFPAGRSAVVISVCLLSALAPGPWVDAAGPPTKPLRLRISSFDPRLGGPALAGHLRLDSARADGYHVVQLEGKRDATVVARMRELGVTPLSFVPDDAYLFHASTGAVAALREESWVRWIGPVQPGWKLSPELGPRPAYATIDLFRGEDVGPATARLEALGLELLAIHTFSDTQRITVRASLAQLEQAARVDAVSWIAQPTEITIRNERSSWVVQSFDPGLRSIWERGLHGEDQIVGHIDGPIYFKSCFFLDLYQPTPGVGHRKIIAYRGPGLGPEAHGTHTAGTVAGDPGPITGGLDSAGVAYAAKISHTDLVEITTDPSNLYDFLRLAHQDGARVHTNSWGDDDHVTYTPLVRDIDLFSYDHEDSLVVVAGSNSPWVRSPENAKNVLAVGASNNGANADQFCRGGTGPTIDGRRKPEIFAPGCDVESAENRALCDTQPASGTSMAAPAIAGSAALVRQYFAEGWYPSGSRTPGDSRLPSAALVKSMLLNSAVDMPGIEGYPSDQEGWGRVLLENALYFDGDTRRLVVLGDVRNAFGLARGLTDHLTFEVTDSAEPLELTLVYTEPPAALMAAEATVNDLDLVVTSPGGSVFRGNVFDFEQGWSIEGGQPDRINNVESIRIESPKTGLWKVRVRGETVNQGLQGYALIATGAVSSGRGGVFRYAEHRVDDSGPNGNGNGVADPGETLALAVSLVNLSTDAATEVTGTLFSSRFDRATVQQRSAAYPQIVAGQASESLTPHFTVTVTPEAACGTILPFRVRSSSLSRVGDSSFEIAIGTTSEDGQPATCQPIVCGDATLSMGIGGAMRIEPIAADLRLSWPVIPDATVYELWHSVDRDFSTAILVGQFDSTTHIDIGGLATPENGFYRVRAVNACGWAAP